MACSIIRNKETKEIEQVLAPNGKESKLYQDILKVNPDKEAALRSWAQVYTPSFKQWFGDWEKGEESVGLEKFKNKLIDIIGEDKIKELYAGTDVKFNSFTIDDIELGFDKDLIITIKTDSNQRTAFNLRLDGDYQQLKISEGSKTIKGIKAALSEKKTAIDFLISEFKNINKEEKNASKVVDENGEPLLVYHGTSNENIEIFDPNNLKYGGVGIYFTTDKDYADYYRKSKLKTNDNGVFSINGFNYKILRYNDQRYFLKKPSQLPIEKLTPQEAIEKYKTTEEEYNTAKEAFRQGG